MMSRVARSHYSVASKKLGTRRLLVPVLLQTTACCLLTAPPAFAQPTQEQVLKSIGENIDNQTGGPTRVLALLVAAAGLALLLVVLSQRRKREVAPRSLNHPGKLLREVARSVNLKPAEIRQLKLLADRQQISNPLTLLLCPSLLARAVQNEAKVDRKLVAGILRKAVG
jgi:hypothetical protein